ncbi:uncharacterized protein [Temnothorax nylanderi]|uniref:uncharacterized protein n=1 Tax=Temnothorax nylanderi TaxID=102681 RepID=UPI003A86149D
MPITTARVAFSVALSLLALLPSLSLQDRVRISDGFSDQYETAVIGPPGRSKWNENNNFSGPPGHNKWGDSSRGPPGGRGPPGLTGGRPLILNGNRPPGRNKVDTESSSEEGENYPNNGGFTRRPHPDYESTSKGENYPYNYPNNGGSTKRPRSDYESLSKGENYPSNGRSTQRPHSDYESSSKGENHPRNYPNNDRSTQTSYSDHESSSKGENYPRNYPNNDRSTQRPRPDYESSSKGENYPRDYPNNDRSTQRPRPDYESPSKGENYPRNYPNNDRSTQTPRPDYESSSKGENYPRDYPNNDRSTQRPRSDYETSSKGESYPRDYPNNDRSTQRPRPDYESSFKGENYPNNDRSTQRPRTDYESSSKGENYPRDYPNNDRSTQRPRPDYDREVLHGPDDRNEYPQSRQCRGNEFRCGSNECLPRSVKCDNKIDCRDASDEESCSNLGNRNRESDCVLPEQPEGGNYELTDCEEPCIKRPGDLVPKNSILNFTCKSNYILSGNTISVCVDNDWYQPPSCLKVCPPLNSTSVDISCSYQGKTVSCSERIMPGTRATLACKSSYKLPLTNDPAYREITCLDDGLWDRRLFRCLPECGTAIARGNTLIVNGFQAKAGVFPWHVGIYAKEHAGEYQQICGGALISNNLVVSAAHCFYDETYNRLYRTSKYAVAVGKHYRDWNAREKYAQQSSVESIQAGGRYQGARGNFANDIALLKLKTPFELTTLVRPVCIDWDNTYEREQLQVGHAGKVVGWGKDIKGEPTRSLQEIDMPFVPYDQCLSAVPVDFRGYLTSDKFCAGHLNGSSVCDGDSGGGLCFEKDGIWYLRGVVSVSPENRGSCDYNSYVGFTSIGHFRDWIREAYVNS